MLIKRFEVKEVSEIKAIYNKETNRISYYYFNMLLIDTSGECFEITKIVYTKKELRQILKSKYIHLVLEKQED